MDNGCRRQLRRVRNGRRVVDLDIDDAQQMKIQPGRVIWIGLHEPSQELMLKLQRYFGLRPRRGGRLQGASAVPN